MKKKRMENPQLNLFSSQSIDPLVREIECLDEQMEEAIKKREFEKAQKLAKKQEELLDELMNRSI
jgi:hypothetical protein